MKELKFTPGQIYKKFRHNAELIDKIVELETDNEKNEFCEQMNAEQKNFHGFYLVGEKNYLQPNLRMRAMNKDDFPLLLYADIFQLRNIAGKSKDCGQQLLTSNSGFSYKFENGGKMFYSLKNKFNLKDNLHLSKDGAKCIGIYGKEYSKIHLAEILSNLEKRLSLGDNLMVEEDSPRNRGVYVLPKESIGKAANLEVNYGNPFWSFLDYSIKLGLKKEMNPDELPSFLEEDEKTSIINRYGRNSTEFVRDAKKLIAFGRQKLK
ncbi:MAG: hypothetical protein PF542_00280 [Nanoarchaeota archaeon]|jgi:hypothetical protein|nr:hypothetical protein [Nanoarchaeota archaeon]